MQYNPDKDIKPQGEPITNFLVGFLGMFIIVCLILIVGALTIKVLRWAL